MEAKDIVFTGLGFGVSDLDCKDGDLSISHNIIQDNGAMRPISVPEVSFSLNEGEEIVYIHRVTGHRNYIVREGEMLYYFTDEDTSVREELAVLNSVSAKISFSSIGNTVIMTSEEGMDYILFKEGKYKMLGKKPPETVINFRLFSEFYRSEEAFVVEDAFIGDIETSDYIPIKDEYIESISVKEAALSNTVINEATKANRIIYPCLVRYAYRLYDGSYIMHSSPVLLVPNTDVAPLLYSKLVMSFEAYYEYRAGANASDILFNILESDLEDWSDIVTSIDIFMTEQISTKNIDKKIVGLYKSTTVDACGSMNYGVSSIVSSTPFTFHDAVRSREGIAEDQTLWILFGDELTRTDFQSQIKSAGNFYRVRTLDVKELELNTDMFLFEDSNEAQATLSSLVFEQRLEDDYHSHDILVPSSVYSYNQRLNISGVKRLMFGGFDTTSMIANVGASFANNYTIFTHIKKEGRDIVVMNTCHGIGDFRPMYLFYPDTDAYKMTILEGLPPFDPSGLNAGYVVALEEHTSLNGAVFFNGFKLPEEQLSRRIYPPEVTDSTSNESNKVYTSEVGNPYHFPLAGINTVGTGSIMGVSSATKALSQGQFGQFPLYVFATDGIWAMEVNGTGLYSSVKPVSRDVCINGDSITQTDDAVLFVSEKGVMMVDGSQVVCLSEAMDGKSLDPSEVDRLMSVMDMCSLPETMKGVQGFMDYIRNCRMAYDYGNSRILAFNPDMEYTYVYSLKTGTWATLGMKVATAVTDYPDVFIQSGTDIVELSKKTDYNDEREISTLMVTRPVKLDDDGYKTVYEMIVRGAMNRNRGAVLLWGSYDGITYILICDALKNRIYRTGGSGYRYYRIGVAEHMTVGETVTLASVKFRRKYTNRMR